MSMAKSSNITHNKLILLFAFIFGCIFTVGIYTLKSVVSDDANSKVGSLKASNPITFQSNKVPLQFQYPSSWPLIYDEIPVKFGKSINSLEALSFGKKDSNGLSQSYGYIEVYTQEKINNLDDYIKYVENSRYEYVKGKNVLLPKPKISYSSIGGELAATIYDPSSLEQLAAGEENLDFIVVRGGLIYHFVKLFRYEESTSAPTSSELFKQMLKTVQFVN